MRTGRALVRWRQDWAGFSNTRFLRMCNGGNTHRFALYADRIR